MVFTPLVVIVMTGKMVERRRERQMTVLTLYRGESDKAGAPAQSPRGRAARRLHTLKPEWVVKLPLMMLLARCVACVRIAAEVCVPAKANHASQHTCQRHAPL